MFAGIWISMLWAKKEIEKIKKQEELEKQKLEKKKQEEKEKRKIRKTKWIKSNLKNRRIYD